MQRKDVLIAALRAAAAEILKHDPSSVDTAAKLNAGDLVTAADLGSEKVIMDSIHASFPDDLVISEETASSHEALQADTLSSLTAWVIDPLDGTNNFKHDIAYSAISIAYVENGVPVIGGVLDPFRNLLYLAEKGGEATCNSKPMNVGNVAQFDAGTRVCTSNSSAPGGTAANLQRFSKLGDVWVDVLGSGVLIMMDVASGKLDLYHHNGLKPWDNAAAFLIAEQAGAKIVGLAGQPITWLSNEIVMGNSTLVDLFVEKMGT